MILKKKLRGSCPRLLFFITGLAVLIGAVLFTTGRGSPEGQSFNFHYMAMDTTIELQIQAESRREAEDLSGKLFAEIKRLEALLSRTAPGSDLDLVNRMAGKEAVVVSPDTLAVARLAVQYARLTEGAFDPTIAPLMDLWGFLGRQFQVPGSAELEGVLPLVDYSLVEIDSVGSTIYLPRAGMSLDFGGIAKGYIVDRGLELLSAAGIRSAFLNAGGDIGLLGSRPDGTPWRIGVRHPREDDRFSAVLPLSGGAVVTSGDYERFFEKGGVRYHHLLDPGTGQPARALSSVTVIAPSAVEADALSTAIFVLGPERGLLLVEQLPGVEAVLVTAGMEVLISTGLQEII